MIGAGTGVAPFQKAAIQQRDNNGDAGLNCCVLRNQKFTDDFLTKPSGCNTAKCILNKVSTAWSCQGKEKVYVQHKLRENAADVAMAAKRQCVCGDALRMAKDVEQALLEIHHRRTWQHEFGRCR